LLPHVPNFTEQSGEKWITVIMAVPAYKQSNVEGICSVKLGTCGNNGNAQNNAYYGNDNANNAYYGN